MTPKVPDYGHREADKKLASLTKRLQRSYRQASLNMQEKIDAYLEKFAQEDAKKRALYDSGELSHEDYMAWRFRKIAGTKQWKAMQEQLTTDLVNADKIAASMINDTLPGVYAENHNYGTYEAEIGSGIDTTYTLYDRFTVARLMEGNPDLLPSPSVDIPKDMRWNRKHIQSAVLQGILTGESMKDIAKRFQEVTGMDERAAIRNARTAVTGAENAGRIDSYKRAQSMGIRMKQVWMATLDGRTRDSHAMMDGEKQDVGKKFSNGCRYPGDPQGAPSEIYNCRCTLVSEVDGSDPYDPSDLNARPTKYLEDRGMSYHEWKQMHGERFYTNLFKNLEPDGNNYFINMFGAIDNSHILPNQEQKSVHQQKAKRPDNEPSFMRAFDYIGIPKDGSEIYKSVNPNYGNGEEYRNNCAKCVCAEEMQWRGYNVESLPYDKNDPVGNNAGVFWDIDVFHYWDDPYGFVPIKSPEEVKNEFINAFSLWGDGSRAMMGIRWKNGMGHAIMVRREGNYLIAEDPQSGKILDIDKMINYLSTGANDNFIMRIDNRPVNENIKHVIKNKEKK